MLSRIINQDINVGEWKIILRDPPIQISVIHTHSYFAIFFRYGDNVGNPLRVGSDNQESNIELLHDLLFDLFLHIGSHATDLLFYWWKIFSCRQMMYHDVCIKSWHIFI